MANLIQAPNKKASPPQAAQATSFRGHIPELDAIRAFGVVLVISVHTWPTAWTRTSQMLQSAWMSMDAFFVLSGFLIAGILLDLKKRPDFFRVFYIRRSLRILPVYYLALALTTAYVYLNPVQFAEMFQNWGSPWWFWIYAGNLPMALYGRFPGGQGDLFNPLWSLQIEEQFYLLFPLCVRFLSLRTLKYLLWAAVIFSPIFRLGIYLIDHTNWVAGNVLLFTRLDGLALGCLIAVRSREREWRIDRRKLNWATLAAFSAAAVFVLVTGGSIENPAYPAARVISYLVPSVASAHLVLWLICARGSKATTILRSQPVRHFSNISYGMYLFHMPVALILKLWVGPLIGVDLQDGPWRLVAVLVVTALVASASWIYFESRLLLLKDRFFPREA